MNAFTVVIPSKTISHLEASIGALRAAGETARVVVVWDGPYNADFGRLRATPCNWLVVEAGIPPFVFARNCNIGIRRAVTDDVVLLNDDAILKTPHGLSILATQAHANPEYGAICPGFDHVGTPNLCSQGRRELTPEATMLVFACVYIPRRTIDLVGLLDERFAVNAGGAGPRGYGLEDDDYSWRIRAAGLKLGVYDPVLVEHTVERTGLQSTFRNDPAHPADVFVHERLFEQKWGKHPRRPF